MDSEKKLSLYVQESVHSSPTREIKEIMMGWTCSSDEEERNTCNIVVNGLFGSLKRRRYSITMDSRKVDCEDKRWTELAQDCVERRCKLSGSTNSLTHSMEQSLFFLKAVVTPLSCLNLGGSVPCSQGPPLDPILSQMNPFHIPTPCFINIHFTIILSSTPRSPKWSLPFRFSD